MSIAYKTYGSVLTLGVVRPDISAPWYGYSICVYALAILMRRLNELCPVILKLDAYTQ